MTLNAAIPIVIAVFLASDANAQQKVAKPAPKPPAAVRSPASTPNPPSQRPAERPGSAEYLGKLLKLSPEQRNKALSGLPPARRAQIEKRLEPYLKMPEERRENALEHLRRMQSLPPQKQNEVRLAIKNYSELPQPRYRVVHRQIEQMKPLSDTDRRALMNTEEFRNKFTPAEQQMIEDISLVTPRVAAKN